MDSFWNCVLHSKQELEALVRLNLFFCPLKLLSEPRKVILEINEFVINVQGLQPHTYLI